MATWNCGRCGFTNKAMNEVCGGKGHLGCKSPKPSEGGGDGGGYGGGGYGPVKHSWSSSRAMSPYAGGPGGQWHCSQCGFKNRPINEICGGDGPLGCKAPKEVSGTAEDGDSMVMAQMMQMMKGMGGKGGKGGGKGSEWKCSICSFFNRASNDVCGGTGPMGCKNPRPDASDAEGGRMTAMMKAQMMDMQAMQALPWMAPGKGKGKGKGGVWVGGGKGGSQWKCAECGFNNRPNNEVCGGTGPMGCKAAKPESAAQDAPSDRRSSRAPDWLCSCGFINRANNEVCGGKGPMGCKLVRSECEVGVEPQEAS